MVSKGIQSECHIQKYRTLKGSKDSQKKLGLSDLNDLN